MISKLHAISFVLLVVSLLFQCTVSSIIKELTLVSTFDSVELQPLDDNDSINLALPQFLDRNMTILLKLNSEYNIENVKRVIFDLDNGRLERWITIPPFVLGGSYLDDNNKEMFYEVLRLQQPGLHTLQVYVTYNNSANSNLLADDETVRTFTVVDEIIPVPVPSEVPTSVPTSSVPVKVPTPVSAPTGPAKPAATVAAPIVDPRVEPKPSVPKSSSAAPSIQRTTVPTPASTSGPSLTPVLMPTTDVDGIEPTVDIPDYISNDANDKVSVQGTKERFSTVTFVLRGFDTVEYDRTNPFLDYRASINITTPNNVTQIVPGYYATDGNSSNSGAWVGNIWLAHFTPNMVGTYRYTVSFVNGADAAVKDEYFVPSETTSAGFFDTAFGKIDVVASANPSKGFLKHDGTHYLKYSEAMNSPASVGFGLNPSSSILSYSEFDYIDGQAGVENAKYAWDEYVSQFSADSQSTWNGGKGKGLIGLVNQIINYQANTVSVVLKAPDDNVFPYLRLNEPLVYDCSKLAQWDVLFEYLSSKGMTINVKLLSTATLINTEIRLYIREMISRFGHYKNIIWNIGYVTDYMQTEEAAKLIRELDVYQHPVFISYKHGSGYDGATESLVGDTNIHGISIVYSDTSNADIYNDVQRWIKKTSNTTSPWVVNIDRQGDIINAGTTQKFRQNVVWGTIMSNGYGYDFNSLQSRQSNGYNEQFNDRTKLLFNVKHGIDFLKMNSISLQDMINSNEKLITKPVDRNNIWTLSTNNNKEHIVYIKDTTNGGQVELDLSTIPNTMKCTVRWYCPVTGGSLIGGNTFIGGSSNQLIGKSPLINNPRRTQDDTDWVVLIQCNTESPETSSLKAMLSQMTQNSPVTTTLTRSSNINTNNNPNLR